MEKTYFNNKTTIIKIIIPLILIYILSIITGFYFDARNATEEIGLNLEDLYFTELLLHNLKVTTRIIFIGLITLGFYSLLMLVFNGLVLGISFSIIVKVGQFEAIYLGLLPHGIFEIPALIISCCIPYLAIIYAINKFKGNKQRVKEIFKMIVYLFFLVLILLTIAAFMEANISKF